ncbi:MAG: hypothetical protein FWE59_02165 [Oscillospiraceae bacterium]|nr:hypothetical protein [Oscillospiraceae bacterium]
MVYNDARFCPYCGVTVHLPEETLPPPKRLLPWLIALSVPLVNILFACLWAFRKEPDSRRNLARASLLIIFAGWAVFLGIMLCLLLWNRSAIEAIVGLFR